MQTSKLQPLISDAYCSVTLARKNINTATLKEEIAFGDLYLEHVATKLSTVQWALELLNQDAAQVTGWINELRFLIKRNIEKATERLKRSAA